MKAWRKVGHNVIHLLYPIRWENTGNKLVEQLQQDDDWQEMFDSAGTPEAKHYFPSTYETLDIKETFREVITNEKVINFFHPSIQDTLFHQSDRGFRAFQYKHRTHFGKEDEKATHQFYGEIDGERICFEWLASELYVFSESLAFLAVRVSLLENWQEEFKGESVTTLAMWMKFTNRLRQNYRKYVGQNEIKLISRDQEDEKSEFFYTFVKDFVASVSGGWTSKPIISQVIENKNCQKDTSFKVEPNAFIHAFVTSDLDEPLSDDELYQVIHIDDSEGESGGTEAFKKPFLEGNVYRRWENKGTYYTAIDYGTVTVVNSDCTAYQGQRNFSLADIFYQHHCRHYLTMIVLQLYYREELQELLGKYSRLTELNDRDARAIADEFYILNQHFFFKRISQEIQGRELWQFYYRIFDIQSLVSDAQHDIQELNQRRIERNTEKQSKSIMILTVITSLTGVMGMNVLIPLFDKDASEINVLLRNVFNTSIQASVGEVALVGFLFGTGIFILIVVGYAIYKLMMEIIRK